MTEFLFVRHAEAVTNTTPERIGGQSINAELTERGQQQALLLGDYLQQHNLQPQAVFSSGAVRADTTAHIALAQARLKHTIVRDARLLELSQGEFEGALRTMAYSPENLEKYDTASLYGKFPGGESMHDLQQRMGAFLQEVASNYPKGQVLVFGHGLAIRALAGTLRGLEKEHILAEVTNNVSITSIEVSGATQTVHFVGQKTIPEYT